MPAALLYVKNGMQHYVLSCFESSGSQARKEVGASVPRDSVSPSTELHHHSLEVKNNFTKHRRPVTFTTSYVVNDYYEILIIVQFSYWYHYRAII